MPGANFLERRKAEVEVMACFGENRPLTIRLPAHPRQNACSLSDETPSRPSCAVLGVSELD